MQFANNWHENEYFVLHFFLGQRPSFLWLFLKASFAETKLQGIKISLSWAWAKYTVCWFRTFANSRTVSHNLTNYPMICSILTFVTSVVCSGGFWWRSPSSQVSSQVTMLWRHHRTLPQKYIRPDNMPGCVVTSSIGGIFKTPARVCGSGMFSKEQRGKVRLVDTSINYEKFGGHDMGYWWSVFKV